MNAEKLADRIEKLETKLQSLKDLQYKITPHKPMVDDEVKYDSNKKELVHKYTYYCSYCGERLRKGTHKHKCGQIQDWGSIQ